MTNSIKLKILEYLKRNQGYFIFGGVIEDFIRETTRCKSSVAGRKCRELYREGKIEREYERVENVDGKTVYAVKYRLALPPDTVVWPMPTTNDATVNLRPIEEIWS